MDKLTPQDPVDLEALVGLVLLKLDLVDRQLTYLLGLVGQ
jgi:hypothetical protein